MGIFYKLHELNRNKEIVEYSTNIDFFLEHQIGVIKKGSSYRFISRLEKKIVDIVKTNTRTGELSDFEIKMRCTAIHKEILGGRYGKGEFVGHLSTLSS